MPELADIFKKYGPQYLKRFGDRMLPSHKKALFDICECRTFAMGGHVQECDTCGHLNYVYHSCCNRSCPKCHGNKIKEWFEKRRAELLPVNYFHIIFTLPSQLRQLVRSNQKLLSVLMKASAYSLKKLGFDPHYVGGKISILCVLHTWTRAMVYHPHAHCLVPGGCVSFDNKYWIHAKRSYFLPVKALSKVFRAKFVELSRKEFPQIKLPQSIWKKQWVVYCKPGVFGTEKILEYLARYVYRIAITNKRILSDKNGKITFKYKDTRDNFWKTMTLDAMEFMRRFLQHIPYKGFHNVRYYGLLSPSNRKSLTQIKSYLEIKSKKEDMEKIHSKHGNKTAESETKNDNKCPECIIGHMVLIKRFPRWNRLLRGRPPPC